MRKTAAIAVLATAGACLGAADAAGEAPATSSGKLRDNPAGQYLLVRTVVGQSPGLVEARAVPPAPGGYDLLKYCWSARGVLGDWAEPAGLAGDMVVQALEAQAWQRDLARAGFPEAGLAEAVGRYEASVLAAGFTEAARRRALESLVVDLEGLRRETPGASAVHARRRCDGPEAARTLRILTVPERGQLRFVPAVLHRLCAAQHLDPDDPDRCDYWLDDREEKPLSFAGETVYHASWADGSTANGRFDPEQARSAGTLTLRFRPAGAAK